MIDFEISQDDLAKASRQMTKARTDTGKDEIDMTCYRETLKFVVTGREFTCPARVEIKGMVRFPLAILPKLRKAAASFGEKPVRIRIEDGRIRGQLHVHLYSRDHHETDERPPYRHSRRRPGP